MTVVAEMSKLGEKSDVDYIIGNITSFILIIP